MTGSEVPHFWSFAEDATMLTLIGTTRVEQEDWVIPLSQLWRFYKEESSCNNRPLRINKVIYTNMVVHSTVSRHPAVLQIGFQTMLYHSTVKQPVGEVFRYRDSDDSDDEDEGGLDLDNYVEFALKNVGPDTYTFNEADVAKLWENRTDDDALDEWSNPVAEYFAKKHCAHLEDRELTSLTGNNSSGKLGSAGQVRYLVKQLINMYTVCTTVK